MPGKIIAVPFLDQIEDIENCLKNNKNVKNSTSTTFSYSNSNKNNNNNHNNNNNNNSNNNSTNNSYNNYNYNNSYYYNKGNNGYYKKSMINGNKNFSTQDNNGNYDSYNRNFDYMRYNSRKNNNNNNNNNNNSSYPYNNHFATHISQDSSNNDLTTKAYPIFQKNGKNTNFNQTVAEQLKKTYPQIYQNTHSAIYPNDQTYGQTDFALNQVTNNLGTLQLPDNSVQSKYSNQGQLGGNKYIESHLHSNYQNASDLDMLMPHSAHATNANNNNTGNISNEDNSMAPFKAYIPSELLDSSNGTLSTNDGINMNLDPNGSNIHSSFVEQSQGTLLSPSLGTSGMNSTPSNINDNALKFTSSPFNSNNVAINNIQSPGTQQPQQPDLSSIGWGSNQMDIQSSMPGRSSLNTSSNSNSGMFGIWNNDMSVWS
ncbi:similar to Saccharomyces cerevisiae YBL081W Non-essential protein of unknown function [Maudiozyma barnettii]|nr:similar to Saccharomyces cerevisiae YBL081W Non-essential protein of unknown function [Kazachstania barnettii]